MKVDSKHILNLVDTAENMRGIELIIPVMSLSEVNLMFLLGILLSKGMSFTYSPARMRLTVTKETK